MNLLSNFKTSGLTINTLNTTDNILKIINIAGDVGSISPASLIAAGGGVTGTGIDGRVTLWGPSGITSSPTYTYTTGALQIGNGSLASYEIGLGQGRSTSGYAVFDMIGDTTYSDYGFRIIRYSDGANANTDILHRGTGSLGFSTTEAAPLIFSTTGTERFRIKPDGDAAFGTTSFADKFTVVDTGTVSGRSAIYANSTGANVATGYAGYFSKTGASVTNMGLYSTASGGTTNVGLYATATGGTTNYGIYSAAGLNYFSGNVGIGYTFPSRQLTLRALTNANNYIGFDNTTNGEVTVIGQEFGIGRSFVIYDSQASAYRLTISTAGVVTIPNLSPTAGIVTNTSAGVLGTSTFASLLGTAGVPTGSGDSGRLALWNGTSTLTSDSTLTWTTGLIDVSGNINVSLNYRQAGVNKITSSGTILASNGSVTDVGFGWVGDQNTGFIRTAADTIDTVTNGVIRSTVDSAGRWGFNTAPDSNTQAYIKTTAYQIAGYLDNAKVIATNSVYGGYFNAASTGNTGTTYGYGAACRTFGDYTYSVGLHINSTLNGGTNRTGLLMANATPFAGNWDLYIVGGGANYFNGNVGIGSPPTAFTTDFPLTVSSTNTTRSMLSMVNTGGGDPQIVFYQNSSARWSIGYEEAGTFDFKIRRSAASMEEAYGSTSLAIKGSNGFIGVNNSSPLALIDIKGTDVGATDAFIIRNSAGTQTFSIGNNGVIKLDGSQKMISSDASIELRNNATGKLTLTSSGNYPIILTSAGGAGTVDIPYLNVAGVVTNTSGGSLGTITYAALGAALATATNYWTLSGANIYRLSRVAVNTSSSANTFVVVSIDNNAGFALSSPTSGGGGSIATPANVVMDFWTGGLGYKSANIRAQSYTANAVYADLFLGAASNVTTGTIEDRMVIKGQTGYVGIGTSLTTLDAPLHVKYAGSTPTTLAKFENSTGSQIVYQDAGGGGILTPALSGWYVSNGSSYFMNSGAAKITVTSAGNVGIGLTPSYKLDVLGTVNFSSSLTVGTSITTVAGNFIMGAGYQMIWDGGNSFIEGSTSYIRFAAASGVENFRIGSGFMSVGTTSNIARLGVRGAGTTSATFAGRFENSAGTGLLTVRNDGVITIPQFAAIGVVTNDASGNLATTPYATLGPLLAASTNYWTLNAGALYRNSKVSIGSGASLSYNELLSVDGGFGINGTGADSYFLVRSSGSNIGIFGSDAAISGGAATDFGLYVYGNNNLDLWTNSGRRLRVTGAGNVGVGTGTSTVPEKLTVAGRIASSTSGYTVDPATANFGLYTSGAAPTTYIQAPATGDVAIWKAGTAPIATFKASGKVGIVTATPLTLLSNTTAFGGMIAANTEGFTWKSTLNEYAAGIWSDPASGVGYGLRLNTTGATSSDLPLFVTSGVAGANSLFSVKGNGDVLVPALNAAGYVTNDANGKLGTVTLATLGAALATATNYWTLSGSNVYRASGNVAVNRTSTTGYWNLTAGVHDAAFLASYLDAATTIGAAKAGLIIFNSDQTQANMSVLAFGTNQSDPNAIAPSAIYGIHTPNSARTTGYNSGAIGFATVNSVVSSSLAERMRITQEGNVGIGTTTINAKFVVDAGALLNNSFGTASGIFSNSFTGTTNNANGVYVSTANYASGSGNASITGNIETYANSSISFGVAGSANNNFTSYTGSLIGVRGLAGNRAGTLVSAVGVRGELYSAAATTISNAYAFNASYNVAAGTVTNLYGLYIPATTAGTSTNYAIYTVSGTNYFGGNVGIGVTTPASKLDVLGTGPQIIARSSASSPVNLQLDADGTNLYTSIQSYRDTVGVLPLRLNPLGGNVGVGGTPSYNFDVIGSGTVVSRVRSTSGIANLNLDGTNGSITNGTGNMYLTNYSATQHIYVSANGGNQITALAGGNVGIGTLTPGTLLQVGDGTGQRTIKLYSGSAGAGNNAPVLSLFSNGFREGVVAMTDIGMVIANTSGLANYNNSTINANPHIVVTSTGLVGIGGTPLASLHLFNPDTTTYSGSTVSTWDNAFLLQKTTAGTGQSTLLNFKDSTSMNSVFGVVAHGSGYGEFIWANVSGTNTAERMRLDREGYLGLGTAAPAVNFHLNGSGAVTSRIQSTSGTATLDFVGTTAGAITNGGSDFYISTTTANSIFLRTNSSTRLTVRDTGVVSISAFTTANNVVTVANTSGDLQAISPATFLTGAGVILQNGNSFTAPMTIGPDDGYPFLFQTYGNVAGRISDAGCWDFGKASGAYQNESVAHIYSSALAGSKRGLIVSTTDYDSANSLGASLQIGMSTATGNTANVIIAAGKNGDDDDGQIIFENTNVSIGTTTSALRLTVDGDAQIAGNRIGSGPGNIASNFVFATYGTPVTKSGASLVLIGKEAGNAITSGSAIVAIGENAAAYLTTSANVIAIGKDALSQSGTVGNNHSIAIGVEALRSASGIGCFAAGFQSGRDNTTGSKNTYLGYNTGRGITTGSKNTIIGAHIGDASIGGHSALSNTLANNVILGDGDGNIVYQASPTNTKIFVNEILRMDVTSSSTVLLYDTSSSNALTIASAAGSASLTAQGTRPLNLVGGDYSYLSNSANKGILAHKGGWLGFYNSITTDPTGGDAPATASIWYNSTSGKFKMNGGAGIDTFALESSLPQLFHLTSDQTTTSSTLADITGFSVAMTGGKTYKVEIMGTYTSNNTGCGITINYLLTGGSVIAHGNLKIANTAVSPSRHVTIYDIGTTVVAGSGDTSTTSAATGTKYFIQSEVIVKCTTSGTLKVQMANSDNTNTITLKQDSAFIVTLLN